LRCRWSRHGTTITRDPAGTDRPRIVSSQSACRARSGTGGIAAPSPRRWRAYRAARGRCRGSASGRRALFPIRRGGVLRARALATANTSPSERVCRRLVARHEDHRCFVAQRHIVKRLAALGIARFEQKTDHRGLAAGQPFTAIADDLLQDFVNAFGGAMDRGRMKPWDPIRQTEKIGQIQLADQALVFAEGGDDFCCVLGPALPAENRPADNLRRQSRHLGQRIDRPVSAGARPALGGFAGSGLPRSRGSSAAPAVRWRSARGAGLAVRDMAGRNRAAAAPARRREKCVTEPKGLP